ncbi:NAD(P)-binding protein [Thozetella sp. PMI_491]|nr:NAD(P)-binding protein [Thozetella sp. PMI_491]
MSPNNTTIPKGSLVLVTGATGFVASHTAKQFLERGYRVRGTVRDLKKASWLVDHVLKPYADDGSFELVPVPDFAVENAFDNAVKGVSAIAHIASVVTFDADPNKVIPPTVAAVTSLLDAALKEPSVKEVVFTSSIVAGTTPIPGNPTHVDDNTWNEAAVQVAALPPPYDPANGMAVYAASKVAAEKALWEFNKNKKPHFTINVVAPASIFGEPLDVVHTVGMGSWLKFLYEGKTDVMERLQGLYVVDVKDTALLHVAAVLDPEVKNARLQAWGHRANWNDLLAVMRRLYPAEKFIDDIPNLPQLSVTADFRQPLALLKKWFDQEGWMSLEEIVESNLKVLLEWYPKA